VHQQLHFGDEIELGLLQQVEDEVDEQYYHEV